MGTCSGGPALLWAQSPGVCPWEPHIGSSGWEGPSRHAEPSVRLHTAGRGRLGRRGTAVCTGRSVLRWRRSHIPELRRFHLVFTYFYNKRICCRDCSGDAQVLHLGRSQTRRDKKRTHWPPPSPGTRETGQREPARSSHCPSCLGHPLTISVWAGPQGVIEVHLLWGASVCASLGPHLERPVSGVGSGVAGSPRLTDLTNQSSLRTPEGWNERTGTSHGREPSDPWLTPELCRLRGDWRTLGTH